MGNLYYGDNLTILREHVKDESVDLVYLDPPFNSNASYNVLFKAPDGHESHAQMEAFEDTWHWTGYAEQAFDEVMQSGNADAAEMLRAMRSFLHDNDMMAYLTMMAVRLLELHRVLKPTGSLYLHCDPVASHYLKVLLDAIFGPRQFRSEIVWRRSSAHNKLTRQYGPIHDTILFYSKTGRCKFHPGTTPYTRQYIAKMFRNKDENGSYRHNELTGAGVRTGESGSPWNGYNPSTRGRHWAIPASLRDYLPDAGSGMSTQSMLDALYVAGQIVVSNDGRPTYKQRPGQGTPYQDIWAYQSGTANCLVETTKEIDSDVKWLDGDDEKLPYPTQKPTGLLERIIQTSTDEGDVVLDPFCGCGTTVHAAQKLKREWIGIDVTHLAISLIQKRLRDAFGDIPIEVHGTPKDLGGAQALADADKYQFQWWAVSLVDAVPYGGKKKGADGGIDGYIYFKPDGKVTEKAVVSVKGGANVGVGMIRDLIATTDREKAKMGLFITLAPPTTPMIKEAASAGLYKTEYGQFPKIQILTIEQLFDGTKPSMPWIDTTAFRKAKRETGSQGKLL